MPDATGPLQFSMSLVGDVNGDDKLTTRDIKLVQSLKGLKADQPGYALDADPTADGTITAQDLALARMNLGSAMKVEPLMLTAGLDPSSKPDGNGVVTSSNVTISGNTEPGATVRLDQGDTGIPREQSMYNATLAESLANIHDGAAKTAGLAVGDTVAAGILASRANDGSNVQVPYVPGTAPGQWRPTPPDHSVAWGPNWGQVAPFAIPNAKQFLPPPPPALNSPAYAAALNMTESLGKVTSGPALLIA
jgi:hypothetical protein